MKKITLLFLLAHLFVCLGVTAQTRQAGGPCEGCEAIHECPVPFEALKAFVTMPDATWENRKPLAINGIVYEADGKTPARGVVIYLYHTDQDGFYTPGPGAKGWEKRHGRIRSWLRTNEKGEYKFVTLRPAPYPDRSEPAHIHITVKAPGVSEYYLDDYVFDDDPLVTPKYRKKSVNRGGSGIISLKDVGNMYKGERNLYLGRNIPGY